jgi:hypothetical protein
MGVSEHLSALLSEVKPVVGGTKTIPTPFNTWLNTADAFPPAGRDVTVPVRC